MHALAVEMTPPTAYGTVHIIVLIVGLSVAVSAAWLLRKIGDRKNNIFMLIFAGVLIVSEIFKQTFLYYVLCNKSICWGEFPFQMCSLPMYLCPLVVFTKNERLRRAAYAFMTCFNILGGFAGAFEPSGVFHEYTVLTVHAVVWHFSLIFLGCYLIFSRRGTYEKESLIDAIKLFVLFCFIAFVINTLIGITVGDTVNMFFVGPNPSPIIVFDKVANKFGWVASTVIYIPIVSLAAAIIYRVAQIGKTDKSTNYTQN